MIERRQSNVRIYNQQSQRSTPTQELINDPCAKTLACSPGRQKAEPA